MPRKALGVYFKPSDKMECLRDYIGVLTCGGSAPESGIYVNNLPGIELKEISDIANSEQATYVNVWADVQNRALRRFKTDVIAEFGKRFLLRQITQTVNLEKKIDTTLTTAPAGNWRGVSIERNRENDQLVGSNLQVTRVEYLQLYLSAPLNPVTIKIIDMELGVVLDTFTLNGSAGWNQIIVNKNYSSRRIFICYDATAITSVTLDLSNFNLQNFDNAFAWSPGGDLFAAGSMDWFLGFNGSCNCQARVRGGNTTSLATNFTNTVDGTNTFGLSCTFSIRCVYDNVVCHNKDYFANALLYCLGSELMTQRINSSAINRWTTVDLPRAKELKKYFEANYKGGIIDGVEYVGELSLAVAGLNPDKNDCCIECDAKVRFVDSFM